MENDKYIGKWIKPYDNGLLAQVGRGPNTNLDLISKYIIEKLDICETDDVLDIGCGNGLISEKVAPMCKSLHGVDFSETLINTANENTVQPNVSYALGSAETLENIFIDSSFDKIYSVGVFQYFDYISGTNFIRSAAKVSRPGGLILISDIPDERKKWVYNKAWKSKAKYSIQKMIQMLGMTSKGQDKMGWWWRKEQLLHICNTLGLKCEILDQDAALPHSHYRYDALVKTK